MKVSEVIEKIKQILKGNLPEGYRIYLFGSWAKGNAEERSKAFTRLQEAVRPQPTPLEWKAIQKFLRSEGISCRSPKGCFREAFRYGLIEENPLWLRMIEDRNLTVHTYDEEIAEKVCNHIFDYLPLFRELLLRLKTEEQKL